MQNESRPFKIAFGLSIFTIIYNIGEGLVSMYMGIEDESLTLSGFGADSFIEVISGLGIAHMVIRIQKQPHSHRDRFERTALGITGGAFYALVAVLIISGILTIWMAHKPETTLWGVIISIISILVMGFLVYAKRSVGTKLNSKPILADANCTMVCVYMSIILLVSSGLYTLFEIPYIDSAGALGLSYFAFKEGREAFEKARSGKHCC
jgi:divalent metal cation (Fe/Co/Zn/Cd) transporter